MKHLALDVSSSSTSLSLEYPDYIDFKQTHFPIGPCIQRIDYLSGCVFKKMKSVPQITFKNAGKIRDK